MTRNPILPRIAGALLVATSATACDRGDVTEAAGAQAPPPAAALYGEAIGLEGRLERLDADLGAVLEGELDETAQEHLLTAEAVTDRLLEDAATTEWLPTGYLVEARLRQIQALADRVVAEYRRGVAKELILEDVAALRAAVRDLRERLASARTASAPPPLDSLLAGYENDRSGLGGVPATSASRDTTPASTAPTEPVAAPEGRPLGEPIAP